VPSEGTVLPCTVGAHQCGLFFVLALHCLSTRGVLLMMTPEEQGNASGLPPSEMRTRGAVVERYVGVVREWSLLPQVMGNAVWHVNCKPLEARYYADVTTVWLLPHIYGHRWLTSTLRGLRSSTVTNKMQPSKSTCQLRY
jgi:hypothetical protein